MEKALSQEERIRRAEEIYNRRRIEYDKRYERKYINYNFSNKRTIKERLMKKMLIQIFLCFVLYIGLYTITNSNYIFSHTVRENINYYLSYDMNFKAFYEKIKNYYNQNFVKKINEEIVEENKDNQEKVENSESIDNVSYENVLIESNDIAIGGAEIEESEIIE